MFFTQVFLVPSMLMSEADSMMQTLISSADVPALIVWFPEGYLPFGMFPRLVILFVHWCAEKWPVKEQPKLFKNFAQLFLDGGYSVILACRLNVISLIVVRGEKVPEMSDADRLSHEG